MTLSIREQVLSAFLSQLSSIIGVDGLTVERNRAAPVQEFPKLVMRDGGHEVTDENSGEVRYLMSVDVEGHIVSSSDDNLGPDLNALYATTLAAALEDCTLGGLTEDIKEVSLDTQLDRAEGHAPCAAFNITFVISFSTTPGNPYSLAP